MIPVVEGVVVVDDAVDAVDVVVGVVGVDSAVAVWIPRVVTVDRRKKA